MNLNGIVENVWHKRYGLRPMLEIGERKRAFGENPIKT